MRTGVFKADFNSFVGDYKEIVLSFSKIAMFFKDNYMDNNFRKKKTNA